MDSSEEEEEAEASISHSDDARDTESDELASFRQQWRLELLQRSTKKVQNDTSTDNEMKAKTFFSEGIAAEQRGNHYQAISYYRQAIQLVPDIEHKMCYNDHTVSSEDQYDVTSNITNLSSELLDCFQKLSLTASCEPETPPTQTHISALPVELLSTILHWIVSSELHLHCLEQFSMVCKGFYMLARQPMIWRRACMKLWGNECVPSSYGGSWRHMFITRPHPYFHGVYISECSYVRQGEASLDSFYRPFHTVVYYRYLRFYSDGRVLYFTSPDDPALCVTKMKGRGNYQSLLGGHFSISEADGEKRLTVVVHARCYQPTAPASGNRKLHHKNVKMEVSHEQNFHMHHLDMLCMYKLLRNNITSQKFEFMLRGRRFNQLTWVSHYCHTFNRKSGASNVSHFEMDCKYTPFWFSRVRSYTKNTNSILC